MLQNIHMLPNGHVLIEGGFMDQIVEVYEMERSMEEATGENKAPVHVIETGCRGLNAMEHSDHLIFMGFMGTLTDAQCVAQIYNYNYEMQAMIPIGLEGKCFTDISLCIDDNFLVGSHTEGFISVINLEN